MSLDPHQSWETLRRHETSAGCRVRTGHVLWPKRSGSGAVQAFAPLHKGQGVAQLKNSALHPLLGEWVTINQNLGHAQCAAQWDCCRNGGESDLSNF
jgi:hypothetical protein